MTEGCNFPLIIYLGPQPKLPDADYISCIKNFKNLSNFPLFFFHIQSTWKIAWKFHIRVCRHYSLQFFSLAFRHMACALINWYSIEKSEFCYSKMRVLVWHFPKRLEQNQIDFPNLHKLSVKRAPVGKNGWHTLSMLVCITKII